MLIRLKLMPKCLRSKTSQGHFGVWDGVRDCVKGGNSWVGGLGSVSRRFLHMEQDSLNKTHKTIEMLVIQNLLRCALCFRTNVLKIYFPFEEIST